WLINPRAARPSRICRATSNIKVSLPKSKPDYLTPKRQSAQAFLTIDADFRQLPERQFLREKQRCH
ncbi:hypothetical protein, partial [Salmonella enterica]|uniref:hypothetical protein n=1 Tax=Salmonella enterica TaxID=28901 RepID=UPI001C3ECD3F